MANAPTPEASTRPGACPATETLAAFVEQRLAAAERPAVEAHLAACFLCRSIALGLAKARGTTADAAGIPAAGSPSRPTPPPGARPPAPPASTPPAGTASPSGNAPVTAPAPTSGTSRPAAPSPAPAPTRSLRPILLLAGVAVVALVVFFALRGSGSGGGAGGSSGPGGDDVVVAVAKDLARTHADLFGAFAPIPHAERVAAVAGPTGDDAIAVHGPVEGSLSPRPRFSWTQVGRVRTYDLVLRGADGKPAWKRRVEGFEAPFPADEPALPPGSAWTWEVSAKRSTETAGKRTTVTVRGSQAFRIASDDEKRRYEAAVAVVRARPAADRPDLVIAHLAAQAGFLAEAEAAAATDAKAHRGDLAAEETLAYVRARLGVPPSGR